MHTYTYVHIYKNMYIEKKPHANRAGYTGQQYGACVQSLVLQRNKNSTVIPSS